MSGPGWYSDKAGAPVFGAPPEEEALRVTPNEFREVLEAIDPRDSDLALLMLDYLLQTGRLQRIGVLDGGQGYLFGYREPKGATKQGYRPGGTQGDRIVDAAVEQARATGTPARSGLCRHCLSAIKQREGEDPLLDDDESDNPLVCRRSPTGDHEFA